MPVIAFVQPCEVAAIPRPRHRRPLRHPSPRRRHARGPDVSFGQVTRQDATQGLRWPGALLGLAGERSTGPPPAHLRLCEIRGRGLEVGGHR